MAASIMQDSLSTATDQHVTRTVMVNGMGLAQYCVTSQKEAKLLTNEEEENCESDTQMQDFLSLLKLFLPQ